MFRTENKIYKLILLLNLFFIVACVFFSVMNILSSLDNALGIVCESTNIIALVFAAFYICFGYHKNAAQYYKVFGVMLIVARIVGLILSLQSPESGVVSALLSFAQLALLIVLTFVKDLGEKRSINLCVALMICSILSLIVLILSNGTIKPIITNLVRLDLHSLYGILTYAKYLDKTERGTK